MNETAPTTAATPAPSPVRAWFFLVWLSWQRQMRARQMVWIALALLAFAVALVGINTAMGRWDLSNRRWGPARGEEWTNGEKADKFQALFWGVPFGAGAAPRDNPVLAAFQLALRQRSLQVYVFDTVLVFGGALGFGIFLNFLLPLWSMSFALESMGGDRESNSLIWLLTRPLPRPAVYLAKFVAMLPWTLALNLGGFGLLCLAGGWPGRETFALLWPSVLCGALAFSSLFFFFGVFFRRPAILSLVYTFFLEIIVNLMPGYLNRASLTFYTKCMMYGPVQRHGIEPPRTDIFPVVSAGAACWVLLGATATFLVLGMLWFARKEYHEIS